MRFSWHDSITARGSRLASLSVSSIECSNESPADQLAVVGKGTFNIILIFRLVALPRIYLEALSWSIGLCIRDWREMASIFKTRRLDGRMYYKMVNTRISKVESPILLVLSGQAIKLELGELTERHDVVVA